MHELWEYEWVLVRCMTNPEPAEWLEHEESACREGRLERLSWLAQLMPQIEYRLFPGGWMAKQLFEETRYCFVYGQFLAAIVLGMA